MTKDELVQAIFSGTRCWCHPAARGLSFEYLDGNDGATGFATWEQVTAVAAEHDNVVDAMRALGNVATPE
jgi:hypothetical protein